MKKSTFIWALGVLCVMTLGLASCQKEEEFDETLLYGKWKSDEEFLRLDETYSDFNRYNGTVVQVNGARWDYSAGEDIKESEASPIIWSFSKNTLRIQEVFRSSNTAEYHDYTVTKLTSTTLCCKNYYGKSYTYIKVN